MQHKYVLKTKEAWSYILYILDLFFFFFTLNFILYRLEDSKESRIKNHLAIKKCNIHDIWQKFVEYLLFTNQLSDYVTNSIFYYSNFSLDYSTHAVTLISICS